MTIILKLNKVYGEVFNYVIGIVQLVAYIDLTWHVYAPMNSTPTLQATDQW